MYVIPQIQKCNENQDELCLCKIVTGSAGNSLSQEIRRFPMWKTAESRSGALLMTIFGETQETEGAVSLRSILL